MLTYTLLTFHHDVHVGERHTFILKLLGDWLDNLYNGKRHLAKVVASDHGVERRGRAWWLEPDGQVEKRFDDGRVIGVGGRRGRHVIRAKTETMDAANSLTEGGCSRMIRYCPP